MRADRGVLARRAAGMAGLIASLLLAACSSNPPAPVDDLSDRADVERRPRVEPLPKPAETAADYRVVGGDTLYAIAFSHGLDYRDVATWNHIPPPYRIFAGQQLRLRPEARERVASTTAPAVLPRDAPREVPNRDTSSRDTSTRELASRDVSSRDVSNRDTTTREPSSDSASSRFRVEALPPDTGPHSAPMIVSRPTEKPQLAPGEKPLPSSDKANVEKPLIDKPASSGGATEKPFVAGSTPTEKPLPTSPPPVEKPLPTTPAPTEKSMADTGPVGGVRWRWPAAGRVIAAYVGGDQTRQGIDIAGKSGDPVMAAADGTVVYSGNGLLGYGELIIVKHSPTLLSAYGHNRKRLVKEGDPVKAGQSIAEMGASGARDALHFEIRKNGKPINPLDFLPAH